MRYGLSRDARRDRLEFNKLRKRLRRLVGKAIADFKLIEAVADHVCETLFLQDKRVEAVAVKIVKLAIAEAGEKIGITLHRERRE